MSLQAELLSFIKDGVVARDAYQHAVSFIKQKNPDLEKHFVKNIGFGVSISATLGFPVTHSVLGQTGMEFRDSAYLLSAKNGRVLKKDMTVILGLGFTDLNDAGQRWVVQTFRRPKG